MKLQVWNENLDGLLKNTNLTGFVIFLCTINPIICSSCVVDVVSTWSQEWQFKVPVRLQPAFVGLSLCFCRHNVFQPFPIIFTRFVYIYIINSMFVVSSFELRLSPLGLLILWYYLHTPKVREDASEMCGESSFSFQEIVLFLSCIICL